MATLLRKTFTKPLPPGASIIERNGQRIAQWTDAKSKKRTAKVTNAQDGTERIIVVANTWTAKYRNGSGQIVEIATGCRDRDAARAVLNELVKRAEKVKAGVMTMAQDSIADQQRTSIVGHIEEYVEHLRLRGLTTQHVREVEAYLNLICSECAFLWLRDLDRGVFERWLGLRMRAGKSARSRNACRTTIIAFCNWCVRTQRLEFNPLSGVPAANEKADPRRKRRALTEQELTRLLQHARMRPLLDALTIHRGPCKGKLGSKLRPEVKAKLDMLGHERALIYKSLVLTGLRRNELASLTIGNLTLDGPTPHAKLEATDEKNRTGSQIPLRADLAADIRQWLSNKLEALRVESRRLGVPIPVRLDPASPVFTVPIKLVRILDRDLIAAGIPKRDERGRTVDVHAMRHTFGTHLSKGGVPLRTAQAAMRHSTPLLTANVYTDPALLDIAGALEALPALPLDGNTNSGQAVATAQGGEPKAATLLAPLLAPTHGHTNANKSIHDQPPRESKHDAATSQKCELTNNDMGFHRQATDDKWWAARDSNPRPPACKADALTS